MPKKLDKYNQKRDFKRTDEPEGKIIKSKGKLRFVVQHHFASREHFDLRLEYGGVLLSWAVPKGPSFNTNDKRLAVRVEDHPLDYRNFEGVIPKGEYGGGTVMLWDEGYWEPQSDITEDALKIILYGKRLTGKWSLVKMKENNWLLIKEKDEYAKQAAGISGFNTSIRTGRTIKEIADDKKIKNPFNKTDVQLASLVSDMPKDDKWVYELKYDGYRILAYIEQGGIKLLSRNENDYTNRFKKISDSLVKWAGSRAMVLDGEMVITDDEGKTDFQALQNHMKRPGGRNPSYIVFDLLALDGKDLREKPLLKRKAELKKLLKDAPLGVHYSEHTEDIEKEGFQKICLSDFEGLIGKRAYSVYSGRRNGDWIKLKCESRQEFVIGGYTLTEKKEKGVSSILLGYFEDGELIYAGRAGTGFSDKSQTELESKFKKLLQKVPPFSSMPKEKSGERTFWLKPILIAEIKFAEWTEDNILRQASFKGLREDKEAGSVVKEKSSKMKSSNSGNLIGGVQISNPDKKLFKDPEVTKLDLARYYQAVSKRMMPYVENRIMSLVCCPEGIAEPCFFKKHSDKEPSGIVKIPVTGSRGNEQEYFYISNLSGVLSLVQLNTVEFHTWGSRIEDIEKPDVMVFDLDPDEDMDLKTVRQGVKDLRAILDELTITSYLKTSGGKGYHVVVPFKASLDWERFYAFAKDIAKVMEERWPNRYTSNVRKEKRKNKIFIDWIRNGRGATSVSPYSVRARNGAKVSMPIGWDELDSVAPDAIGMEESIERLKAKDPWKDFFKTMKDQQLK